MAYDYDEEDDRPKIDIYNKPGAPRRRAQPEEAAPAPPAKTPSGFDYTANAPAIGGTINPPAAAPDITLAPPNEAVPNLPAGTESTAPAVGGAIAPTSALAQPPAPRPAQAEYERIRSSPAGVEQVGGIGGKILRVGEAIGSAIAPARLAQVPGTRLHHEQVLSEAERAAQAEQRGIASKEAERFERARTEEQEGMAARARAGVGLEEAQAELARARAAGVAQGKPESIQQEYSDAVMDAVGRGVDPQQDPEVQRLGAAYRSLHPQAEKIPPHITVMAADGKAHIMERDPQKGTYTVDRGVAPATYGQVMPFTHTTEVLGSDGVMHRVQFNPETSRFDLDLGPAPGGAVAHSIFQAGAIERVAPTLIADINQARPILGKLSSYYKQWTAGTPIADPKAAELMSELMSFAALQPALHAFRSANAMEAFEKIIGSLARDPDATIAAINGILKTATRGFSSVVPQGPGATPPANNPPAAAETPKKKKAVNF